MTAVVFENIPICMTGEKFVSHLDAEINASLY